jgi:hypothetical protein
LSSHSIVIKVLDLWRSKLNGHVHLCVCVCVQSLHCNQSFGLMATEILVSTLQPGFWTSSDRNSMDVSNFFFLWSLHCDQGFGLLTTEIQSCPLVFFLSHYIATRVLDRWRLKFSWPIHLFFIVTLWLWFWTAGD